MRILITGADGQLGRELQDAFSAQTVIPFVYPEFDLLSPHVEEQIEQAKPDTVIHAAAYTNVDKAEEEPDVAMAVNGEGTARVAAATSKIGARLIYISTDYVFDGTNTSPYEEHETPNPLGVYGRSKWAGEQRALALCRDALVVRTSWLYGRHGANFVKTIMRLCREQSELRVVSDQRGSPTHAEDLAAVIAALSRRPITGIVHATGSGECSWHEFATAIVAALGLSIRVRPISTREANRKAPRPAYSVMGHRRLAELGLTLPHWKDALHRFIAMCETGVVHR